jgi:hypothetical protein
MDAECCSMHGEQCVESLLGQGILQDPVLHFTVVQFNLSIMNGLSSAPQTNHLQSL